MIAGIDLEKNADRRSGCPRGFVKLCRNIGIVSDDVKLDAGSKQVGHPPEFSRLYRYCIREVVKPCIGKRPCLGKRRNSYGPVMAFGLYPGDLDTLMGLDVRT